ncbi:MAG: hypothetical protein WKF59_01390 [Chitinophagaceae bacterium]
MVWIRDKDDVEYIILIKEPSTAPSIGEGVGGEAKNFYMSVLIFIDQSEGHIKKNSFEAASYGAKSSRTTRHTLQKELYLEK